MAIPDDVLLAVWGPFGAACLLCLCVSWVYLWRLSLRREREPFALACGTISVAASLAAAALVPADVSLVSAMKGDDGTFQPWAANESDRKALQSKVQLAYFVLYGLLVLLAFVVLPFAYFFSEEKGRHRRPVSLLEGHVGSEVHSPLPSGGWRAAHNWGSDSAEAGSPEQQHGVGQDSVFLWMNWLLAVSVTTIASCLCPSDVRVRDVFLTNYSGGEDSLRFLLSLFVLFGMFLLIVYTGFGMSALPMRLVLGERSAAREVADVGERRRALRTQLDSLARHGGGSNRQRSARLEEQLHSLDERQRRLEEFRDSCTYRLRFLIRPLQIVLGVVFALLGLLLWTSLLLSNVDKAMHSLGFHMGYLLEHPELPNPLDVTLVWLQRWGASILDSALILALLLLLIACSTYGLQRIGIWCLFLQMYRLRMGRARPQAVVLLCMALVFVALALNVLLHSACPQYSTYGSQRYQGVNGTQPCDAQALPDDCVMSRGSAMLESFFFKAWIFGAAFYWATWLFIGSVVISFLVVVIRGRQSSVEVDADEFEDDDDDDEPLIRA
ncbi:hypothetical protein MRX96_033460 [Rhipicephalus microplus]